MSIKPPLLQRGVSLVELIVFIVIITVGLTGILVVMNQVMRHSADPLLHKQAMAAAESLLEEIELQDFTSVVGATTPVTQANRASQYHIVTDYNGFSTAGIFPLNSATVITGLGGYNANVSVVPEVAAWNGVPAGSAVLITVAVTDPQGQIIQISGYRTAP